MKQCVIIPDSFKGTLSSTKVCEVIKTAVLRHFPGCRVLAVPVADGGEGTVDCFLAALPGGERVPCTVPGPTGSDIPAFYGRFGGTAVIEMAAAAGLPLVSGQKDPSKTTTRGVGRLIRLAVEGGAEKILLGLGGSCTNDAGCGCAAELGVRFYDEGGNVFVPTGGTLKDVRRFDTSVAEKLLAGVEVTAMCDVTNPLFGESGAAYIFAPQKGADDEMVRRLDAGLRSLGALMDARPGLSGLSAMAGAGAAGGLGAGVCAFLGGRLQPGIDAVLGVVDFASTLRGCDYVFTGEGRFDSQSMHGKVVDGVAKRAKAAGVPVVVIAGDTSGAPPEAYAAGVAAVFSTNPAPRPFEEAKLYARESLAATADNICRLIKTAEK